MQKVIPELVTKHDQRIDKDAQFQKLEDDIKEYKEMQDKKEVSLNLEQRKKEKEELEKKKLDPDEDTNVDLPEAEETPSKKEKHDDPFLKETANILSDMILLTSK